MDTTRKFQVEKEGVMSVGDAPVALPVGSIVLDVALGDKFDELLADGSIVEVKGEEMTDEEKSEQDANEANASTASEDAPASTDAHAAPAEPQLTHAGKNVLSHSTREVNGVDMHVVTLESGEVLDITDEEFDAMIERAKVA